MKSPLLHIGAATQDWRSKEYLGSQPPRQYAPTPHWPYCEQHGVAEGQGLPAEQVGIVCAEVVIANVAASAAAALNVGLMVV